MIKQIRTICDISEAGVEQMWIDLGSKRDVLLFVKTAPEQAFDLFEICSDMNRRLNRFGTYFHPKIDKSFDKDYWEVHCGEDIIYSPGACG